MCREHQQPLPNATRSKRACTPPLGVREHSYKEARTLGVVVRVEVGLSPDALQPDQMRKFLKKRKLLEMGSVLRLYGKATSPDTHPKVRQILLLRFCYYTGRMTISHKPEDSFNSQASMMRKPKGQQENTAILMSPSTMR